MILELHNFILLKYYLLDRKIILMKDTKIETKNNDQVCIAELFFLSD